MAELTFYVNTASTGGDGTTNGTSGATAAYATYPAFDAAEQTNLVTDGNNYIVLLDGAGGDATSRHDITGWTTGAGNDLVLRQNPAGTAYKISYSDAAGCLLHREDYLTIDGITIENTHTNAVSVDYQNGVKTAGDNLVKLKNCHVIGARTSAGPIINAGEANLILEVENVTTITSSRWLDCRATADTTISYCSVMLLTDQIGLLADTETVCKNTYIGKSSGSAEDFHTGSASPAGSNNTSSDTSATVDYTGSQVSKAPTDQFTNITFGTEDFTLKAGSDLLAFATPIGGITTDIIGTTRDVTTPDAGAYELVAAGGFSAYWARNSNTIIQQVTR
jgi:hypothetical protein